MGGNQGNTASPQEAASKFFGSLTEHGKAFFVAAGEALTTLTEELGEHAKQEPKPRDVVVEVPETLRDLAKWMKGLLDDLIDEPATNGTDGPKASPRRRVTVTPRQEAGPKDQPNTGVTNVPPGQSPTRYRVLISPGSAKDMFYVLVEFNDLNANTTANLAGKLVDTIVAIGHVETIEHGRTIRCTVRNGYTPDWACAKVVQAMSDLLPGVTRISEDTKFS